MRRLSAIEKSDMSELATKAYHDPQAFTEIYESFFPRIYNYVRYRVKNPETTDDLTSLIFEKVFKNIKCFRPEQGNFTAWLFAIAHNVVSDHFRNWNKNQCSSLDVYDEIAGTSQDLGEVVVENEIRSKLLNALAELSERERNIIALKFWSGLTNRSISKLIGLSESNVGVIIYRAIRRLHSIIESGGDFDERKSLCRTL